MTDSERLGEIESKLVNMESKLDKIEGKLSDKWVLPVIMLVLTSLLGAANYFVQRDFESRVLNENTQRQEIGKFIAQSKINFYKGCKSKLIAINEKFEALTLIGPDPGMINDLDKELIVFRKFLLKQQLVDNGVIAAMKAYSDQVGESNWKLSEEKLSVNQAQALFRDSQKKYDQALEALLNGLTKLSEF